MAYDDIIGEDTIEKDEMILVSKHLIESLKDNIRKNDKTIDDLVHDIVDKNIKISDLEAIIQDYGNNGC